VSDTLYDVVIIGGGVNGTGIARDASLRGMKVALVEKKDFAAGASGANSGMIHGGIRYLRTDPHVTELACIDSGYIQRIAPHLLFRVPLIFPVLRKGAEPALGEQAYLYAAEVLFSAYDRYQPYKRGKPSTRLTVEETLSLEPAIRPEIIGAVTTDEWGIDPQRLCALNALDAETHGATLLTHTRVIGLPKGQGGELLGVEVLRNGHRELLRARAVVNAGGPWASLVASLAGVDVKLRPGKGVHLTLDRRLSNYGVITNAIDGRQIFLYPHETTSTIGTTDDDYFGDRDDIAITQDEVEYLIESIAYIVPSVRQARVLSAWAGVRPTLYDFGPTEDALSREHEVIRHDAAGVPNFYSLLGGKLASYRIQSEELTDLLARDLGNAEPCRTHLLPLPGGESLPAASDVARAYGVAEIAASRAIYRHGAMAPNVLAAINDEPWLGEMLCPCEQVTYAEARHCLREEHVANLSDLRRRCRLGIGQCQGLRCAERAASLWRHERKLSAGEARAELDRFLRSRFESQRPVLDGAGLGQQELVRGSWFAPTEPSGERR
jgi:glycerol-3-phosphate dehydrogenase